MSLIPTTRADLIAGAKEATPDVYVRKGLVPETVTPLDGAERTLRFVISTDAVDRDNDTIDPKGWDLKAFKNNPVVLWAHDYKALPVGKAVSVVVSNGKLVSDCEFATHEFAETVYQLLSQGFLKATSVGFRPTKYKINEERQGLDFTAQELMEYSIVPVPANPEALQIDMPGAKAAGIDIEPILKWAREIVAKAPLTNGDAPARVLKAGPWNQTLSKLFDVEDEPAEPAQLAYKWASRFLSTPVKDLYETSMHIPPVRMGEVLSALDETFATFETLAVRNLGSNGSEYPPEYETIQLNSSKSKSFLVDGTRFLSGAFKFVAQIQPSWRGVTLTCFVNKRGAEQVVDLLAAVQRRSREYQFLKGEAMTLGGQFLARGNTSWDDLFLDEKVKGPITRTAQLINERGADVESRGLILMGPPGTGKTLAARALMSEAPDATFIWASARDFYYSGGFGGIELAYDLASENAPAIVLFEDVDSFLDAYAVDLLKTELDGLKQRTGIVTVLTTNFPQRLPEALLDRPGRFHDVLNLSVPDITVRRAMLAAWAPTASATTLDALAVSTDGLSGAHLRELVRFASTLQSQDGLSIDDALTAAHAKVGEQRQLVEEIQSGRPVRRAPGATIRHAPVLRRSKGGLGHCDRCGADGDLAAAVCPTCREELHAWSHEAAVSRTAALLDEVTAEAKADAPMRPLDGKCSDGYELRDGMCYAVEKPKACETLSAELLLDVQMRMAGDADACRICSQKLVIAMPRLRDDLGVVCAPCWMAAGSKPPAGPPAADLGAVVRIAEASVLDIDDDPHEGEVLELSEILDGVIDDELFDLSPDDIRAALRSAITSTVSTVVRDETRAALDRARGRVD